MEILFFLLVIGSVAAIVNIIILFFSLFGRKGPAIRELQSEVAELKQQMKKLNALIPLLQGSTFSQEIKTNETLITPPVLHQATFSEIQQADIPLLLQDDNNNLTAPPHPTPQPSTSATPPPLAAPHHPLGKDLEDEAKVRFEHQFGTRVPVWIGGIAFIFAGFYLVRYSIETNLLTPTFRLFLGGSLGITLLFAAEYIFKKPSFANGLRITQALLGAGIAVLYMCFFASSALYELLSPLLAFIGMAGVTALAVLLSLRHGLPIAALGLVGGFVTPALMGGETTYHGGFLFSYLYIVFIALMVVIRQRNWWVMAFPTVLGAFLWVLFWLFGRAHQAEDSFYVGIFLQAVSFTFVVLSKNHCETQAAKIPLEGQRDIFGQCLIFNQSSFLNYFTLGGALFFTAILGVNADFGLIEWGLFFLLTSGGLTLAFLNTPLYGFLPWFSLASNLVMLFLWSPSHPAAFGTTLVIFAFLHVMSGYRLQSRATHPLLWALLVAFSALGYYILAYFKFHFMSFSLYSPSYILWALLALISGALSTWIVAHFIRDVPKDHKDKQSLLAIYSGLSTTFLSITLAVTLSEKIWVLAVAGQICAFAWLQTRVNIKALRLYMLIFCVFEGFLLLPQIGILIELAVFNLVHYRLWYGHIPVMENPWILPWLLVPLFVGAAYFQKKKKDGRLVYGLELASIILTILTGYDMMRHITALPPDILMKAPDFIGRSLFTLGLFICGFVLLWMGEHWGRITLRLTGVVFCGFALFRLIFLGLVRYNPLWSHQFVGDWPLANGLLSTYLLPFFCILFLIRYLPPRYVEYKEKSKLYLRMGLLLLLFTWVNFSLRQMFHGGFLDHPIFNNREIYAYSILWIAFGLGVLFYGTLRNIQFFRLISLAIIILASVKVFLFDTAHLNGLLRVFSFVGLGISLLGLSWFYVRFIFIKEGAKN